MGQDITRRAVLSGAPLWLAGCAGASYASGRAPPPGRILIMPVHVTLGERRLGGSFRLRRDWSEAVRAPVLDSAAAALARGRRQPVFLEESSDLDTAWALARLHRPVAESLMNLDGHITGRKRLPTRGRPGLGSSGRALAAEHGARTGLFISITGEYPEGLQRAAEIVLGEVFDAELSGMERRILVSLADLETGAMIWSGARTDRSVRDARRAARHAGRLAETAARATDRAPGRTPDIMERNRA